MFNHHQVPGTIIVILAIFGSTLGCGGRSPAAPTPPARPAVAPLTVTSIEPTSGPASGLTPVVITGTGFQPGAIVTLNQRMTNVTVVSSTSITARTTEHAAGTVDLVVTNPGGESAKLTEAYSFAEGLPLSVVGVSPNLGSTAGGLSLRVTGTGFHSRAVVTFDGVDLQTHASSSTTLVVTTPAHAPGHVDIAVTNPDGQTSTLARGYTYARPETFDVNGSWTGFADDPCDSHGQGELRFTVEDDTVVDVSCGSSTFTFSPRPVVRSGEFSFAEDERVVLSGRFLTATIARGTIDLPPCGPGWFATKR